MPMLLPMLLLASSPYVPIYEAMPSRAILKRPVPELKHLGWMVGAWRCHVHSFAVGRAPARDFGESSYTAKFIMPNALNGQRTWLQLADTTSRDLTLLTFDPMARRWVLTGIEWPVSYGVSTGEMSGHRLVLTGGATVFGRNYHLRQTITKVGENSFTILNEERRPDGRWIRDDEYDFVRSASPKS